MQKIVPIFILTLLTLASVAQTYTDSQVKEDLQFLIGSIEEFEPALYGYNPDFKEKTDAVIRSVVSDMSVLAYFSLASKIVSLANEGHFNLGDWSDVAHKGFVDNTYKYMPLSVMVIDDRIFVWINSANSEELQRGDEILSINGRASADIIASMLPYIPSDGHIETYRLKSLTMGFPWMYYLYVEQPESFAFEYKRQGQRSTVTIEALTREGWTANYQQRKSAAPEEATGVKQVYEFDIKGDVAVLTLKDFTRSLVEKHDLEAGKLYEEIFEQLKTSQVSSLIVDLRDNTGGRNEFADDLIPFIMKEAGKGLFKTTESWKGKKKDYSLPKMDKLAFDGAIYALVNGRTYSAGAEIARYLKEYGNATVIGEETGTRYEGFAAGSTQSIVLPNSGIRIGIPRYHLAFPPSSSQKTSNRGLLPDHEVRYTIEDLMNEKDLEMEVALGLIK
ncbi:MULTISPECIES: S41 family peptidase [unclassified Imperialibacter]|uniref:S41 family peptidase n=1 Tax=unclassified Imperialibacter TaxID=2629706 RepID=UPI00125F5081|nr:MULTISPECIES: S41 family peptidase [unclassified Imperialibacter]